MAFITRLKQVIRRATRPKKYFLAAFYISLGGFLNGYDTGSIGSVTEMPVFKTSVARLTPTMRGLTVSFLLLAGVIPSLLGGALADKYGHLRIVLAGALFFTAGAAVEAGSVDLAMLLIGRSLAGIGEGLYLGNLNVYICEIAPMERRGTLVAMPQALVTLGTCVGYFTCYGTIQLPGDLSWRLPFILQAAGGALMALACFLLPESPRWLIVHDQRQAAIHSMKLLDFARDEIEQDFNSPARENLKPAPEFSWNGVLNIFNKEHRFRTILALFVLGMVQLCGIDGVLYYAPTLFAQAGLSAETASFVASGVSGILMFAISVPAFLLADRWGRRTIMSCGGILLASCMAVVGSLYASNSVTGGRAVAGWAVIVLIFVFALTYVSTWGIVGKIYASEILPAHNRATANSLAQALNFFTNFLTAFITPIFLARSSSGPYFLFAALTALTLIVLWIYMPETRGRSLESIQQVFDPPAKHVVTRLRTGLRRRKKAMTAVVDEPDEAAPRVQRGAQFLEMRQLGRVTVPLNEDT